jgi:hypothetical protein
MKILTSAKFTKRQHLSQLIEKTKGRKKKITIFVNTLRKFVLCVQTSVDFVALMERHYRFQPQR